MGMTDIFWFAVVLTLGYIAVMFFVRIVFPVVLAFIVATIDVLTNKKK
jgi:hypothetical protein